MAALSPCKTSVHRKPVPVASLQSRAFRFGVQLSEVAIAALVEPHNNWCGPKPQTLAQGTPPVCSHCIDVSGGVVSRREQNPIASQQSGAFWAGIRLSDVAIAALAEPHNFLAEIQGREAGASHGPTVSKPSARVRGGGWAVVAACAKGC